MNRTLAYFALVLEKDFSLFCNQKLHKIGLTQGLLYFIIYIGKHPGCSMGELTSALHMDWGHTQRSIDRLIKDGFVHKERNEQDKRSYHLTLLPKGESAFAVSYQVFPDWDAIALQNLSTAEKNQLFKILEKLNYSEGEFVRVRNNKQPYPNRNNNT